ncbi:trypsin-like peptidase domain-containing protein [Azospirillum sp. ST 5-10]|uniref:trypsin-like peptidase domain-containing protein n=1 Tax=unclassified Azospirillum TaxID=2630922 RepID=UPI003F4A3F92
MSIAEGDARDGTVGFIRGVAAGTAHFADQPGIATADSARLTDAFREARRARAGLEAIIDVDNQLPFNFLLKGSAAGSAICKIEASGTAHDGSFGAWSGTGFLVGPNVLLTNHHVVNSRDVAQSARCIFDFQADAHGKAMPTRSFRLDPARLFITSPYQFEPGRKGLDYTFVWVDMDEAARDLYGHIPLSRGSFLARPGDCANIIHHPAGRPKSVSLQDNRVAAVHEQVIHYTTDTERGSSGGAVFTNEWTLLALHHAAEENTGRLNPLDAPEIPRTLNEGIRLAAIALDLESRLAGDADGHARHALQLFGGVDSATGYFGSLGRSREASGYGGAERVVTDYRGESKDVDVGFWNVEWLTDRYVEKLGAVAEVIADLNLDIWALSESSPEAARALVAHMKERWGYSFDCAFSEPEAPRRKQSTTVLWNTETIERLPAEWPGTIAAWFGVRSEQFDGLRLEAVHGKVFDRYPGLFRFAAKGRGTARATGQEAPFDFFLVPLHLKAKDEGSLRRQMASRILAAAVNEMVKNGTDRDWIIGGDVNDELASGDFKALTDAGMTPLGAADEEAGAFSYIKGPKSLIDHIFLSPNLARRFGAQDCFVVARDRKDLDYVKQISDHRPVLVRLSLADSERESVAPLPAGLAEALTTLKP